MPLKRLALAGLLVALCALALACGDDDGGSTEPEPSSTEVTDSDEEALDQLVETALAALRDHSADALAAIASDRLLERRSQLDDRAAECFPEGGELSVANREIRPGREGRVRVTIDFTVQYAGGETDESRRDWRFERAEDGSYKLTDAPDCPFRNRPRTDAPTEVPADAPTEAPTGVPTEAPAQIPLETLAPTS